MSTLNELEHEELLRLRQEVSSLASANDNLISTVHMLSGELLKRRHQRASSSSTVMPLIPLKKSKPDAAFRFPQKSVTNTIKKDPVEKEDVGLPNEIMIHLFKYMERSDLDRCQLVCRRWKKIVDVHQNNLQRRKIRLFKIIETSPNVIMFSAAAAGTQNIKFHFNVNEENQNPEVIDKIAKMLKYSKIRRLVLCSFHLTEVIVHDLNQMFKKADVKFHRVELIGLSLRNLSPDSFQKFIGENIKADQYFIDSIKDAVEDHFSGRLFEKTGIKKAEDVTIYDVTGIDGDEDVQLDVGDDVLLDFIFGKYTDATDRSTLYLDQPSISTAFVYNALKRFAQETDLKHAVTHSEIAHCRDQIVHNNRSTRFEYNVLVQAEYSAYNALTNQVLEAKVSRTPDDTEFVHVTLTIASN